MPDWPQSTCFCNCNYSNKKTCFAGKISISIINNLALQARICALPTSRASALKDSVRGPGGKLFLYSHLYFGR